MSYWPHPIGFLAGGFSSVAFFASSISTGAAINMPAGTLPGDLLLLADRPTTNTGTPTIVLPSGFNSIVNTAPGVLYRCGVSWKIADGTEGASLTGSNGDFSNNKILLAFRGDGPISTVATGSIAGVSASTDPTAQVCAASGGKAPQIVFGVYGADSTAATRSMVPTATGEVHNTSGANNDMYVQYLIQNTAIADATIDMGDGGANNTLQSFFLRLG